MKINDEVFVVVNEDGTLMGDGECLSFSHFEEEAQHDLEFIQSAYGDSEWGKQVFFIKKIKLSLLV